MDYGKYRFEQAKREKEARKNQRVVDIKEVRLYLNIDTHDFNTKLNNALKFIKHGAKVKVSIRFREMCIRDSIVGNKYKSLLYMCESILEAKENTMIE